MVRELGTPVQVKGLGGYVGFLNLVCIINHRVPPEAGDPVKQLKKWY
jgi:hypothetical protein